MKTLALSLALIVVASLALVAVSTCQPTPPVSLKPGDKAPDLKLKASDGKEYDLAQFRGAKAVAICWFPRAGSQGARNQCAALEAAMPQIPRDKLQVFGCSTAALDATTAFAQQGKYSFPVLSDSDMTAAKAYGCARPDGLSERWTFLIDDKGIILAVNRSITPQTQGSDLTKMLADAGLLPPATGATPQAAPAGQGNAGFVTYDYSEMDEGVEKAVRLAIPTDLHNVRGILVNTNAAGGDTRARYTLPYLKAFAALHGLAFVGAQAFDSHPGSVTVLEHALNRFARESGHAELVNVPFVVYGFSAGGGFANRLVNTLPERVIASAPLSTAMRMKVPPGALDTPVCMFSGEQEERLNPQLNEVMQTYRPRGAHFAWAMVEGQGHREIDQATLAIPFLDHCIRLRYPPDADPRRGSVALKPLALSSGWLADNSSWRSGLTKIVPNIAPYNDPGAEAAATSWLPDEDIAFVYRAYATFAPPLKLTVPPSGAAWVLNQGADITITVDASAFTGWQQLALYNGARKLAEITQGPARFPLTGLKPGVYAFLVMGTDAHGSQRAARPALVIVSGAPVP